MLTLELCTRDRTIVASSGIVFAGCAALHFLREGLRQAVRQSLVSAEIDHYALRVSLTGPLEPEYRACAMSGLTTFTLGSSSSLCCVGLPGGELRQTVDQPSSRHQLLYSIGVCTRSPQMRPQSPSLQGTRPLHSSSYMRSRGDTVGFLHRAHNS